MYSFVQILKEKQLLLLRCLHFIEDWKPEVGLKDPYWSPTSPTTDDNLITSAESEDMRYGQCVFLFTVKSEAK